MALTNGFKKFVQIGGVMALLVGGYIYSSKTGLLKKLAPEGAKPQNISPNTFKDTSSSTSTSPKGHISVGVDTWGGWAGGLYFNEGFKASEESHYFKDYGITVDFVLLDDFAASREALKSGKIDLLWGTADSFPTEVEGLKDYQPKIVFQPDWSRGGDCIVVQNGINSVADLKGKKVSYAVGTPSHTLLLWMLSAGDLNYNDIQRVEFGNAVDSAGAFKAGKVDGAVVWSPDDEDCVKTIPGSKVLKSTKEASHIIADVLFARKDFIDSHAEELKSLLEGWSIGAAEINSSATNKDKAADIMAAGFNQPKDFCLKAIGNVRLCTFGDNINFFNMNGDFKGVKGEDLYNKMAVIYNKINLAPAQVPAWRTVIDTSALRGFKLTGLANAAEGQTKFTKLTAEEAENTQAFSVKRVTINFASGSSTLDANAKNIITFSGLADLAKGFADSRIKVEGNTDNVGSHAINVQLSTKRAKAVASYLSQTYGFDPNRFVIVGNAETKAIADNSTSEGREKNRRTDFELLNTK